MYWQNLLFSTDKVKEHRELHLLVVGHQHYQSLCTKHLELLIYLNTFIEFRAIGEEEVVGEGQGEEELAIATMQSYLAVLSVSFLKALGRRKQNQEPLIL